MLSRVASQLEITELKTDIFAELLHPTVVVALTSLHKTKDSHLIEHTR